VSPFHAVIGKVEPTLGEQYLHISVAQGEAEIKPDRALNAISRKLASRFVKEDGDLMSPRGSMSVKWKRI
jgi:hypothetical protein